MADLVGLFVVALVAAFGGGTLRDLLLNRSPLLWIAHDFYAIAILDLAPAFALVPGTFGGVIRDILCKEVPTLFRKSPLYVTCAFFGCFLYFALLRTPLPAQAAIWISIIAIALFRLAAVQRHWTLPVARD